MCAVFLLSPAVFLHKILSFCISAQTQYDICNSISYEINYLRHSSDDLPLLFLVQLADRTPIIAKGVFSSSSSPLGFFWTTRLASGFLHTKSRRKLHIACGGVAEKEGFEPSQRFARSTPLAGEPLQPYLGTSPAEVFFFLFIAGIFLWTVVSVNYYTPFS